MRLILLAGILLVTAGVLVLFEPGSVPESDVVRLAASPSRSGRRKSFGSQDSARDFLARFSSQGSANGSDFDRLKSAVRMFGEHELLEMARFGAMEAWEILQQAIIDSDLPDDAKNNLQVILRDSIPSPTE